MTWNVLVWICGIVFSLGVVMMGVYAKWILPWMEKATGIFTTLPFWTAWVVIEKRYARYEHRAWWVQPYQIVTVTFLIVGGIMLLVCLLWWASPYLDKSVF
jgi:hypothetical protein